MPYRTHAELSEREAARAKEEYAEGLVGRPLPCGCTIGLGEQASVCDDACHTAWNIVYGRHKPNASQEDYSGVDVRSRPYDHLVEYSKRVYRKGKVIGEDFAIFWEE